MTGKKLGGRYEIVTELGRGAFGITFVAVDTQRPGHPKCVVKQLKPLNTNPYTLTEAKRFFDQEAMILEILGQHDQIPRLLAHFEENQEFYLVQEYIPGQDLSQEMLPGKHLSEAEVSKLLQEILEVLAFVHQQGVIHRDIKPSNIRRRQDGKIILIDFGSVKQITTQVVNSIGQTSFTVAIGTRGYMPSEQADGNPQFSSDVYAVGMIGIQALTGISPKKLPKDVNNEILWRERSHVNPHFANVLDKMVRYDFRQRYLTASQAMHDLNVGKSSDSFPQSQMTEPTNAPSTITLQRPSFTPQWKVFIFVGIAALLATVIVTLLQFTTRKEIVLNREYENHAYEVKIKYPENWARQDIENAITQEVVTFISPKQSDRDKFPGNVTLRVENLPQPLTLAEYTNLLIKEIKNNQPDAKIDLTSTTLANKPANQLVSTITDGTNHLKTLQVFTLKADKAYVIIYTAKIDNYEKYVHTAESMIKSFDIQSLGAAE
ncbi:MAG: serine/threonine protein kinase [Stigonema ocellatum SAG 48.90 = DSM 106950]|nr:serine/threonine protein kinase [Stigonema ocellatum SAG 48.90 = DSM 106950]